MAELTDKLDERLSEEKPTSLSDIVIGATATTGALLATSHFLGPKYLLAGVFGLAAYPTAYMFEVLRGKVKFSFKDLMKEGLTGIGIGLLSLGAYNLFPSAVPASGAKKWDRTFTYMSGIIAGLPLYRAMVYFRDAVGIRNTFKGLFNGKMGGYLRDAWKYDISKNWAKAGLGLAIVLTFPQHLILNYIRSDVWKVAASKAFSFVTRLIMGGKGDIKTKPKPKEDNYKIFNYMSENKNKYFSGESSNYKPLRARKSEPKYDLGNRVQKLNDKYQPQYYGNNYSLAA